MDSQITNVVLLSVMVAFILYKFLLVPLVENYRAAKQAERNLAETQAQASMRLATAMEEFPQQMKETMATLASQIEKAGALAELFPGLVKVCEAQVVEVGKMREAVAAFTKAVVRDPGKDEDVLEQYDETQADDAYARGQYMAQGYSPEEAAARVEADNQKKMVWSTPGE